MNELTAQQKLALPYNFIAIEGNIGAGKTTFCELLSRDFNCRLILEQFTDNPFLPLFYDQPERYAFPVELFFMTERHKQLQAAFSAGADLFTPLSVADYFFLKTLLFAKNNLNDEEFRLFQRLFEVLNATFPKPDILIYLHRSVENVMRNIKKRGRNYETDISADYLLGIQNVYFEYFRTETELPIVIIDVEDIDYLSDSTAYQKLVSILQKTYAKGIHRLSIRT
ncbi:MAG: deoxynucleoside kinase [Saprospiraceae bacterium]|nr:deoxynucleoside kinase [Saprospiraceae bacterium]